MMRCARSIPVQRRPLWCHAVLAAVLVGCGADPSPSEADDTTDDGADGSSSGEASTSGAGTTASDSAEGSDSADGSGEETAADLPSSWHTLAPLPGGARQETAVASLDGRVYVVGGFVETAAIVAEVEVYDAASDTWSTAADLPAPMHHAHLAAVDDALYLLGSLRGLGFGQDGASWRYDPGADTWTAVTAMPEITARGGGAAAAWEGLIYVVGGLRDGQAVDDAWTFEPETEVWLPVASLPTPRDHLGLVALDGLIYAVGGRDGSIGGHTDRLDIYDPQTDSWSAGPPMLTSRGGVAVAATATQIFAAGGEGNDAEASGVFSQLEVYDPARAQWQTLPPMPTPRHGTGAAAIGSTVYVPGGATVQALGAVADHEAWGPAQ